MPWLNSLLKRPEPVVEAVEEAPPPAPTGPQLAVLVPDIAGISSFRLRLFPDAQTAEQHISGLGPEIRRGVHAFWSLHDRPVRTEDMHVEALVLIRAREGSDVMYVVSFLDLESANSFTRFEVRRGLQLPNVMICWAAFTQIREELDGVTVHPNTAPITSPSWLDTRDEVAVPIIEEIAAAPQLPDVEEPPAPAPEPETPVEAEAREAIERYLQERDEAERNEPPLIEDRFAVMDRPRAAPEVEKAPEPEETLWSEPDAEMEEPLWPSAESAAPAQAEPQAEQEPEIFSEIAEEQAATDQEPEIFSEIPEEQAALEQAFVLSHEGLSVAEAAETEVQEIADLEQPVVEIEATLEALETVAPVLEAEAVIEAAEPAEPVVEDVVTAPEPAAPEIEVPRKSRRKPKLSNEAIQAGMIDLGADEETAPPGEIDVEAEQEENLEELSARAAVELPVEEESEDSLFAEAEAAHQSGDPAAGIPQVEQYDEFDIAFEVERLLRNRNWGRRDEPFDGFKSPPGRF